MTDVILVNANPTTVTPIEQKLLSVDIVENNVITIEALGGFPTGGSGSRVYAQQSAPGTNIEGDVWFNPLNELIQIMTGGVWVPHGHDDGYF